MKIIAVIPARYGSTRLPGKPLITINDKPMIQWVYENVKKVKLISRVIVATDDNRIFSVVRKFNGEVMLTSSDHTTGTDRIAEVVRKIHCDYVLNVQGDEPLISPRTILQVVQELVKNRKVEVVTPVCRINHFSELISSDFVKVVLNKENYALYFTRSIVPFIRDILIQKDPSEGVDYSVLKQIDFKKYKFYRHIGVYGYTRKFLLKYVKLQPGYLEQLEKLEQLRILEYGYKIKVVIVKDTPWSVDTMEDYLKVKEIIHQKKVFK